MNIYSGKVAVVTGAGSGIGRSLAIQLAKKGARLALSDVDEAGLQETDRLLGAGALAKCYLLDVASREAFFAHADQVVADFGSAHFIFNNAGVTLGESVNDMSIEDFEWLLGINLWGVIYGTKAFLPIFLKQNEGCIVNISSVFGLITVPNQGAYHISKYGVRGLTECLWSELKGTGVRAIVVHPGGINTAIAENAQKRSKAMQPDVEKLNERVKKTLTGSPDDCAEVIIDGVAKGRKRILVGPYAKYLFFLSRWFPNSYGLFVGKI